MPTLHQMLGFLLGLCVFVQTGGQVFAEASTTLQNFNSPIVKIEADKGAFLITTDSGIQWIQVEEEAKVQLKTLDVGDIIDIVVEVRPDNAPPLLKSWKLARSASSCKVFDGKTCRK
ncbi:MAG: hypothetical protein OEW33_03720 [Nitrospirota bacterium]|jgi:UPF0288 family protein (methanogenesis marker protein 3)|nr:hypothetical protein [Nitrospirota bacterium]MDH4359829.1 hypothetical protein [Nitrospirota bacterium]